MSHTHPKKEILKSFALGELDSQLNCLVSSHLSYCNECQALVNSYEQEFASNSFNFDSSSPSLMNFSSLFDQVVTAGESKKIEPVSKEAHKTNIFDAIGLKEDDLNLSRSIKSLLPFAKPFKSLMGKLQYSRIDLDGEGKLYFLFFEPGSSIPEHSHEGNEYAYVVAGSFSDDKNDFVTGDFAHFDHEDTHDSKTEDPEGCLLLVKVDGPFVFKKGTAKLLNPFRKIFF